MQPTSDQSEPNVTASWDKQPNEPEQWFDRFDKYARPLGAEFTVFRAMRLYGHDHPGLIDMEPGLRWIKMAGDWHWEQRAKEWNEHERFEQRRKWELRRDEIRETDFLSATTLKKLVDAALEKAPDFISTKREEIVVNGVKQVVMIKELKLSDVIKALETASKVSRLAAEMSTERTESIVNADVMVKGYVGISPDDWDTPDLGVPAAPVADTTVEGSEPSPSTDG